MQRQRPAGWVGGASALQGTISPQPRWRLRSALSIHFANRIPHLRARVQKPRIRYAVEQQRERDGCGVCGHAAATLSRTPHEPLRQLPHGRPGRLAALQEVRQTRRGHPHFARHSPQRGISHRTLNSFAHALHGRSVWKRIHLTHYPRPRSASAACRTARPRWLISFLRSGASSPKVQRSEGM